MTEPFLKRYALRRWLSCSGSPDQQGRRPRACVRQSIINPISDICWSCMFPMTIGSVPVFPKSYLTRLTPRYRFRFAQTAADFYTVKTWLLEPYALTDVTRVPYCIVNMGLSLAGRISKKLAGALPRVITTAAMAGFTTPTGTSIP